MAERALLGALVAALITALARRLGALDESGQWGAFCCGIAASLAGWPWALLLVGYFLAANAITVLGAARKSERTVGTVPQVSARNVTQVLANGGLFALLAVKAGSVATSGWGIGAAGALAAASADTWATEIGTLWGGLPRSIISGRVTLTGMSGGITAIGTVAALVGAAFVALSAAWLHQLAAPRQFILAVAAGGFAGSLVDSLLGATVQARRWCEHCKQWTERRVHPCSYRTVHARGFRWFSNDLVNAAATVAGATGAVATTYLLK